MTAPKSCVIASLPSAKAFRKSALRPRAGLGWRRQGVQVEHVLHRLGDRVEVLIERVLAGLTVQREDVVGVEELEQRLGA